MLQPERPAFLPLEADPCPERESGVAGEGEGLGWALWRGGVVEKPLFEGLVELEGGAAQHLNILPNCCRDVAFMR